MDNKHHLAERLNGGHLHALSGNAAALAELPYRRDRVLDHYPALATQYFIPHKGRYVP
jgi:hypothetical protein